MNVNVVSWSLLISTDDIHSSPSAIRTVYADVHTAKQLKTADSSNFNHPNNAAVRIIINFRPVILTMTGRKGSATVTQNSPKYLGFRITEGLFHNRGIKCNWKLVLEYCARFVAYRVKNNFLSNRYVWLCFGITLT